MIEEERETVKKVSERETKREKDPCFFNWNNIAGLIDG